MGTRIFDFLTESFLFDDSLVQDYFHGISDQDIFAELTRYREFCLSVANEIEQEILAHDSNLKVFAGTELVPPIVLMQSAFYVEQYILYDPLFPLTQNRIEAAAVMNQYMGFSSGPFNRMALVQAIRYLKHLTPMAAAGYVKFIPASYVFEPPKEIPFSFSSNQFADVLPPPLLKFFHDNAVVEAMKRMGQRFVTEGTLYPTRAIHIGFRDHYGPEASFPYFLFGMEYLSDKTTDTEIQMRVRLELPESVPDLQTFTNWVHQSINQSSKRLFDRILLENVITSHFGARYLSVSPFIFELLKQALPIEQDLKTSTFNAILGIELPFLQSVDPEVLMTIRRDDGEAFLNFRLELERHLRELRCVQDPEELRIRTDSALHEVTEVQLRQVNRKVRELKKHALAESLVLLGGLATAVQTGGWSLAACAVAVAAGYKSLSEYRSHVRENPAFFLWKVLDRSRRVTRE